MLMAEVADPTVTDQILSWLKSWGPLLLSGLAVFISYKSYVRAGRADVKKTQRELRREVRRIVFASRFNIDVRGENGYDFWPDYYQLKDLSKRLKNRNLKKALETFHPVFRAYNELWQERKGILHSLNAALDDSWGDARPDAVPGLTQQKTDNHARLRQMQPVMETHHETIERILNKVESKHG